MKKITVLYGNYGSGKTELALNIALKLREEHDNVMLVDLDIVNPFFRSSKHRAMLEAKGVKVISPSYANTGVDLPTLPPGVYSAFKGGYAVFDVGGDPAGATALGGLKEFFDSKREDTEALFVVNTFRPFQESAEKIKQSIEKIVSVSRLKPDGFVLNSNLGSETTGEQLEQGYQIIKELTELTGLPLKYISGTSKTLERFAELCPDYGGSAITIDVYMRPYWM